MYLIGREAAVRGHGHDAGEVALKDGVPHLRRGLDARPVVEERGNVLLPRQGLLERCKGWKKG